MYHLKLEPRWLSLNWTLRHFVLLTVLIIALLVLIANNIRTLDQDLHYQKCQLINQLVCMHVAYCSSIKFTRSWNLAFRVNYWIYTATYYYFKFFFVQNISQFSLILLVNRKSWISKIIYQRNKFIEITLFQSIHLHV